MKFQHQSLNKEQQTSTDQQFHFSEITLLIHEEERCGLTIRHYQIRSSFGKGTIIQYDSVGLQIQHCEFSLTRSIHVCQQNLDQSIVHSCLLQGELILDLGKPENQSCESGDSYLLLPKSSCQKVQYLSGKKHQEIKTQIGQEYLIRHSISIKEINMLTNARIIHHHLIIRPIDTKMMNILSEILSSHLKGLLLRLHLEGKVLELFIQYLNFPTSKHHNFEKQDQTLKKIYSIQRTITENLHYQYSIHELAREIGMNEVKLKREFKRIVGNTLHEYSMQKRIEKAKQLLKFSRKPIYEISEIVGYQNPTHFTAAFKKKTQLTPNAFRKKHIF